MKRTIILIVAFLFLISFACRQEYKIPRLECQVYRIGKGYGYTISKKGKIMVRQEHIPSHRHEVFCDSLDAVRVSTEVMYRISNEQSPNITDEDLLELDVKTKC